MSDSLRLFVAIPAYGHDELTSAVVGQLIDQACGDVCVIDNRGSWVGSDDVLKIEPGRNLGWLRSCNVGLRHAFTYGYDACLLLNNDVHLSSRFLQGFLSALDAHGDGIYGPLYDDAWPQQRGSYAGPAEFFIALSAERSVPFVDGTSLLITKGAYDVVGPLDEENLAQFGWAADMDLCYRGRLQGLPVLVTERSYLNHIGRVTASRIHDNYAMSAVAEARSGMIRKYGLGWEDLVGDGEVIRRVFADAQVSEGRRSAIKAPEAPGAGG